VSLTAPADGARYLSPTSITLSASASGPELNDLLHRVEFYLNGTLAGTVTSAPYNFSWNSPALGSYTLTAVAVDSQGAQSTSSARSFIVSDQNQAPTVSIVTPLDNSRWHSPASFMFQANANAGEANDIVRVDFYVNGVLQGTDSTSPYSVNLSSLAAGTYTLMARAVDGQNAQTDSATRTITVSDTNAPPTVSITAPTGGANYPTAPAGFTINATAGAGEVNGKKSLMTSWGRAALAMALLGASCLAMAAAPSFRAASSAAKGLSPNNLALGSYTRTAEAVDSQGAQTTSSALGTIDDSRTRTRS
jgi:hypothetical protein